MKVTFVKDMDYDAYMIWIMLSSPDPAGNENRAKSMGINKDDFLKISKVVDYRDIEDFVLDLAKKKYEKHESEINRALEEYQKSWDKINDAFSSGIERITEHKWYHDKFKVVVSPFHPGVSNNGGDTVVRYAFENPDEQRRVTAHEILMSHIWSIMFDRYGEEAKENEYMHYWGLNEITTTAVLGLELGLNTLWTKKYQGYDQYLSNYPQLKQAQQIFKKMYLEKEGFLEFLDGGIEWIDKKYNKVSFL